MTRELYVKLRNAGSMEPMYEYYTEQWKKGTHEFMLNFVDFVNFFRMWPEAQIVYNNIMTYYDHKFKIMFVQDLKTGNIIKYY